MWSKLWLGLRSIAMTVLFPGTVTVYLPYEILAPVNLAAPGRWSWWQYPALLSFGVGLVVLLKCIWEFGHHGKGTLAPFDETRKLVVQGLYRYVRNPMYVGVMLMLVGESWFFQSVDLLLYTGMVFMAFNVFILGYEELRLRSKYGAAYAHYCRHVGRWLPGKPYRERGSSQDPAQ